MAQIIYHPEGKAVRGTRSLGEGGDNVVRRDAASSIPWDVPYAEFSIMKAMLFRERSQEDNKVPQ